MGPRETILRRDTLKGMTSILHRRPGDSVHPRPSPADSLPGDIEVDVSVSPKSSHYSVSCNKLPLLVVVAVNNVDLGPYETLHVPICILALLRQAMQLI